jgi:hypothetical protein
MEVEGWARSTRKGQTGSRCGVQIDVTKYATYHGSQVGGVDIASWGKGQGGEGASSLVTESLPGCDLGTRVVDIEETDGVERGDQIGHDAGFCWSARCSLCL